MNILVTGGAGFIGRALSSRLVAEGHKVRVLDDFSRGKSAAPGCEVLHTDCRNGETVKNAIAGIDTVFHLAAVNGTKNFYERPAEVLDVGIRGTLSVLDAARWAGVKRFVYFSSSEVYQQPTRLPTPEDERCIIPDVLNPRYSYAGSKLASELLVVHSGIPWQIIRPHNVYGPDMGDGHVVSNLIEKITRLRVPGFNSPAKVRVLPIQGSGEERRAFCYIDDMVDGILIALDKGEWNTHYNVGNDHEVSIAELAHAIAYAMGAEILKLEPSEPPKGETSRRCPDLTRLRALGYAPKVWLQAGLAHTVGWYTNRIAWY